MVSGPRACLRIQEVLTRVCQPREPCLPPPPPSEIRSISQEPSERGSSPADGAGRFPGGRNRRKGVGVPDCVTSGKLQDFSVTRFPHLENRGQTSTH